MPVEFGGQPLYDQNDPFGIIRSGVQQSYDEGLNVDGDQGVQFLPEPQDFFKDPIVPGEDPEVKVAITQYQKEDDRIQDLSNLLSVVQQSGTISQSLAAEGEHILPGIFEGRINHYTKIPTRTRYNVSVESLKTKITEGIRDSSKTLKNVTREFLSSVRDTQYADTVLSEDELRKHFDEIVSQAKVGQAVIPAAFEVFQLIVKKLFTTPREAKVNNEIKKFDSFDSYIREKMELGMTKVSTLKPGGTFQYYSELVRRVAPLEWQTSMPVISDILESMRNDESKITPIYGLETVNEINERLTDNIKSEIEARAKRIYEFGKDTVTIEELINRIKNIYIQTSSLTQEDKDTVSFSTCLDLGAGVLKSSNYLEQSDVLFDIIKVAIYYEADANTEQVVTTISKDRTGDTDDLIAFIRNYQGTTLNYFAALFSLYKFRMDLIKVSASHTAIVESLIRILNILVDELKTAQSQIYDGFMDDYNNLKQLVK